MEIIQQMLKEMPELSKPRRDFIKELFETLLRVRGKANYLNLSRYSHYDEKTFRRNAQKPFAFESLNQEIIMKTLSGPSILAGDSSFIKKSGKHTFGLGKFWHGTASRSEKGLEISLLSLVDSQNTAMTLVVQQTPPSTDEESRVDFYLRQLQESKPYWPEDLKHSVFDGFYAKIKFVDGICNSGLDMIGKLRFDANLRYIYTGPQKSRGRHKHYDGKVFFDALSRFEYISELEKDIHCYVQNVWHVSLKRSIRVIILLNTKKHEKITHILLFSTDLNLSALQIIAYYSSRYQIEFLFRDAKQYLGLEDSQARNQKALDFHFNTCFTTLNLAKCQAISLHNPSKPFVFSLQSQKCLSFNEHLLDRFISRFDLNRTLIKSHPAYQELCVYGAIAS